MSSCEGGDEADELESSSMDSSLSYSHSNVLYYDNVMAHSNSDEDIDEDLEYTNTYRSYHATTTSAASAAEPHEQRVRLNQYEHEPSGLNKIKNVVFHKYKSKQTNGTAAESSLSTSMSTSASPRSTTENDYLKMKLNKLLLLNSSPIPSEPVMSVSPSVPVATAMAAPTTTNTSAYDTCSQMSSSCNDHSMSSSSAASSGKNKKTSSTTSGNTSGDYNQFSQDVNPVNEDVASSNCAPSAFSHGKK